VNTRLSFGSAQPSNVAQFSVGALTYIAKGSNSTSARDWATFPIVKRTVKFLDEHFYWLNISAAFAWPVLHEGREHEWQASRIRSRDRAGGLWIGRSGDSQSATQRRRSAHRQFPGRSLRGRQPRRQVRICLTAERAPLVHARLGRPNRHRWCGLPRIWIEQWPRAGLVQQLKPARRGGSARHSRRRRAALHRLQCCSGAHSRCSGIDKLQRHLDDQCPGDSGA